MYSLFIINSNSIVLCVNLLFSQWRVFITSTLNWWPLLLVTCCTNAVGFSNLGFFLYFLHHICASISYSSCSSQFLQCMWQGIVDQAKIKYIIIKSTIKRLIRRCNFILLNPFNDFVKSSELSAQVKPVWLNERVKTNP